MATIKKSNKKKIVIPICLVLVVAIIAGIFGYAKVNSQYQTVTLTTISTDEITETVNATGDVTAGVVREYKAATVATCKEVFVKVGDKVKKGDILATFDTEALEAQINSLQATYNAAAKSYSDAVAVQKAAKIKLDSINKQIPVLEKQLKKAKANTNYDKFKEVTTKKNATVNANAPSLAADSGTTYDPTIGGLVEALGDLVNTISTLTKDIEETNELVRFVMEIIAEELQNGNFDSEAMGAAVGAAVADAIRDGVFELVESGAAVEMIQTAVASIDWESIGKGIGESNGVQLTTIELQLAALYAQKEIFELQASPTTVNAQKQLRDGTKEALDTLKETQEELSVGWVASINGTITECNLVPGGQTTLIETGIKLENMNKMVATISLGEYDIHKVKVGMPAVIKTAYGEYTGEIASIAPTATGGSEGSILDNVGSMAGISGLSSLTASGAGVKCTVTINDPDENIIPGFQASVEILTGEYNGVPVVPIESIVLEKEGKFVYLYNEEEETVTKTKIETGAISDTAYEIISGITVGDKIVSTPLSTYEEDTFKVKVKTDK